MDKNSLNDWLAYIEQSHPNCIDMGLERTRQVANKLDLDFSRSIVVTVAGTNGKGTTCRFVEQACLQAGFTVGVYSSPHIINFNERIRLNGIDVDDASICAAFSQIDEVRGEITLTYFEYATLGALLLFKQAQLDIVVLEVGLGGRLDATNIVDANIAAITSIGLDHQSFLGNTLDAIASEKAGIFKPAQKVVIGYSNPQSCVLEACSSLQLDALFRNKDFGFESVKLGSSSLASAKIEVLTENKNSEHQYTDQDQQVENFAWMMIQGERCSVNLSNAGIPKQNVLTALAILHHISNLSKHKLPLLLSNVKIQQLIDQVSLPGRMQLVNKQPRVVLDVGHNQDAARLIVSSIKRYSYEHCHIVIGMLKDKNIEDTIAQLIELNATWYCVDLPGERGEKAERLETAVQNTVGNEVSVECFARVEDGLSQAMNCCNKDDIILVVGSFILASECVKVLAQSNMN